MPNKSSKSAKTPINENFLKLLYFTLYAANASVCTLLVSYFRKAGLPMGQISILRAYPIARLIATPIGCAIADKTGNHRTFLIFFTSGGLTLMTGYQIWTGFSWFFVVVMTTNALLSPGMDILDSYVFQALGADHSHRWGEIRLWGSLGYGCASQFSGWVSSSAPDNMFHVNRVLTLISMVLLFQLPNMELSPMKKTAPKETKDSFLGKAASILSDFEVLRFLVLVFFLGIINGAKDTYLTIHLEENLGGTSAIVGSTYFFACAGEFPFFYFSQYLIYKIGHLNVLHLGLLCAAFRCFVYSVLENPQHVLFVEPLHGLTFAAPWAAARSYAHLIALPGLAATTQAFVSATYSGCGEVAGSLFGGLIVERLGIVGLFRFMGFVVFSVACLSIFYEQLSRNRPEVNKS